MTPMGSRGAVLIAAAKASGTAGRSAADALDRPGDRQHLLVRELLRQRVRDPVGAALVLPRDEAQAPAVVVEVERAPGHPALLARLVEDRRVLPRRPLDAVVLAVLALRHDDAVGAVAVLGARHDVVDVR